MKSCSLPATLVSLAILLPAVALAQFGSSIQGTIVDQSGAVIPGAGVTLTDISTGIERMGETNVSGVYRFPSLGAGEYEVRVEADGFAVMLIPVDLLTNQIGEANAQLDVQAAAERVVVTAEAPVLDTADSRLQSTVEEELLDDLPFGSRNMLGLAAVAPGITGYGLLAGGTATGPPDNFNTEVAIEASGNGRNSSGNLYTLDGLNMTSNIIQGRPNVTPNVESVEEVAIQTNTFSVEQTNASSVQVAITTKSGSNELHGTASYFFTNQGLTARTVFSPGQKQKFKKNILNGTIGGPIVKNSTFFFGSYEGLRSELSLADSVRTFESREFVDWAQENFPGTLGTQFLAERPPVDAFTTGNTRSAADVFGTGASGCGTAATQPGRGGRYRASSPTEPSV
ncbi:MAG: carboxypeptidase-like regulatory domain-containing protein, partial [Bryobacterales bacterium]|nr:carboxypeptidase-like regulatory domain-containing protein [Bryobacterales bacterium]